MVTIQNHNGTGDRRGAMATDFLQMIRASVCARIAVAATGQPTAAA